jgi:hypothetical protein
MSKKIKKLSKPVQLYGSRNGWIKVYFETGDSVVLRPDFMTTGETPAEWYSIGKYVPEKEGETK